jgi:hypothetical protein
VSEAGGLMSTDYRLGFHKPIGRPWQPIIYSAVNINGVLYAVIDACILIGTVEEQDRLVARIREQDNARGLFTDPNLELQGGAIKGASYRWRDARVPFQIAGDLPTPERVSQAISHWQSKTKVQFDAKQANDTNYVVFVRADGCSSFVGRRGGEQPIFVGDACTRGNLIHEIGHCIGLYHEQSRSDRNDFVDVKWQNIDPTMRHNFNQEDSDNLTAYDFGSIMHYPPKAFSINGQETIVPKYPLPPNIVMGQREALSANDIIAVSKLYP